MPYSTSFGLFIPMENLLPVVVTTLVFVILGLIVFALAFFVIAKAAPFSVRRPTTVFLVSGMHRTSNLGGGEPGARRRSPAVIGFSGDVCPSGHSTSSATVSPS